MADKAFYSSGYWSHAFSGAFDGYLLLLCYKKNLIYDSKIPKKNTNAEHPGTACGPPLPEEGPEV